MNRRRQKKLIAILLFVSCFISAWLLIFVPSTDTKRLESYAQADSLLRLTLSDFNVAERQRSASATRIDSTFSRTVYRIQVPSSFSKTQFHAVLQRRLQPYQIALPARVIFPERHMHIHLKFGDTILGTVKLITDEDLTLKRSLASIIIAFNNQPSRTLVQEIVSLGEPIPAAVILTEPYGEPGWWDDLQQQYRSLYLWPKTPGGDNLLTAAGDPATGLEKLAEWQPDATLLSFYENSGEVEQLRRTTSFSYVSVNNAILFNDGMNESEFSQSFRTFVQRARSGYSPVAVIMGSEETLQWTREALNTFKKGGLYLTRP